MTGIQEITQDNFEREVLQSAVPVLVDLYAPWCGPCRMMAGILEAVAGQLGGRAKIVKINTDEQPALAAAFSVESIPTLALVHKGEVVDGTVGVASAKAIMQMIDRVTSAV